MGVEINWLRWFVFALVGLPAVIWLFSTRNNALRAAAVLWVLLVIQDTFVFRRYIVALGVGPSIIAGYIAFLGLYFQRGRFPSLGAAGGLWMLLLAAAGIGVVLGSIGTGLVLLQIVKFQELYLEGFIFFVLGVMALEDDEETLRFFLWFLLLVVGGVTFIHLFSLATGWRPASIALSVAGDRIFFGGVFINPNTLGAFYAMTVPAGLVLLLRGGVRGWRRAALLGALVAMSISLLLTAARSGLLFTVILSVAGLMLAGFSPGRVIGALVGAVVVLGTARLVAALLLPEVFGAMAEQLAREGLKTDRLTTWLTFIEMLGDHPIGVGLHPQNMSALRGEYQTALTSAHNIYLDQAIKIGIQGAIVFVALLATITLRSVRAVAISRVVPERRVALLCCALTLAGFLVLGLVEPLYNDVKINQAFWMLAGIGYASSTRALGTIGVREAAPIPPRFGSGPLLGSERG